MNGHSGGGGGSSAAANISLPAAAAASGPSHSAKATRGSSGAAGGRVLNGGGEAAAGGSGGGSGGRSVSCSEMESALSRVGLVAVLDLCVALYKFVNVELHSQGWYAVRVRVVPGPEAVCTTTTVLQCQQGLAPGSLAAGSVPSLYQPSAGGSAASGHNGAGGSGGGGGARASTSSVDGGGGCVGDALAAARRQAGWLVEESGCCFRSCVFRIRYCYEEVKLQTAVLSRIFVTNLQGLSSVSVTLEFELMFQEANLENPAAVPDEFQLRTVARESVTLSGLSGGLAEYYGCTFSDEHFGLCSTGLFAGMAGFAPKDLLERHSHRTPDAAADAVGSSWLCHLMGDGSRRESGQHYRSDPNGVAASASGGGASAPGSATPSVSRHTHLGLDAAASSAASSAGGIGSGGGGLRAPFPPHAAVLDFSDQELRKKVIRMLHHVVEAPSIKQGVPQIPSEAERLDRLAAAYEVLAEGHRRSRDRLAAFMRGAPPECFAPQNLDVLRALLASAAAAAGGSAPSLGVMSSGSAAAAAAAAAASLATMSGLLRGAAARASAAAPLARLSHGAGASSGGGAAAAAAAEGGGGGGSAAAAGAAGAGHVAVPSVPVFMSMLRRMPTTAAALQQLDGLLVGLSADSRTDWAVLGWVMRTVPRDLMRHLKLRWEAAQPDVVLPFILWDSAPSRDAIAAKAAAHRQQKLRVPRFRLPAVQPGSLWGSPGEQPVLVVDDSQGIKWLAESDTYFGEGFRPRDEAHVAIFVHGFQGASTDLCLVKAHLMLMYPYLECFSSKTNEGNTHDSLQEMGKRLAAEMAEFLAPFSRSTRRPLKKITLVGHSIGNLILRAALTQPEFAPFKPLLWLYISVCGPHLGFLYGSNAVVDTGLMLLKTIGKGKCLHQLTFSDAPQLTDCYLYRLAHECPLSAFKLVLVVSSPQDRYVPYHSSALTTCPQAERDSRRGRCYSEMLRALTAGVGSGTHLFRLGVDFSLRSKSFSFSKLVGRTAHIEFIESQLYVGLLMWGLVHRYTMLAPAPHSWL
ncbi:hypothetical protein PLESTF_001921500 [Pleodorina starrii]|nr:hypothetical protein PLESTF_001921500 [Pleodorina starrii]